MELLCDASMWKTVIDKKVDKRKDKVLLSYLCNPMGRLAIIEAINQGRYVVQPPRTSYINKKTGQYITKEEAERTEKVRELYACTETMDNVVLTLINNIYMTLYKDMIHPSCLSYQKGIGVKKIIYNELLPRLKKGQTGYKIDISKYFDSVNIETLEELLTSVSTNSPVDKVLWDMYHDNRVYLGKDTETTDRYMSLRQGCPTATFFADICLNDIDTMASKYDVVYVRYSDDLLIIGPDADEVLDNIKFMLLPKGLELNPKKVERISTDTEFTFLGCKILNGVVDMSDESVERFKRDIKHITKPLRKTKGKGMERDKLTRRAIKQINYKLRDAFQKNNNNWGFEQYFYGICNTDKTIKMLDEYVKDHIKQVRAGSHIHTRYTRITPNEWLMDNNYLSMVHMFKLFKAGPDVYKAEIRRLDG